MVKCLSVCFTLLPQGTILNLLVLDIRCGQEEAPWTNVTNIRFLFKCIQSVLSEF